MGYSSNMPSGSAVHQTPGSADVSMAEEADYSDGALEEKWINYQRQLATVFQDVSRGSLHSASETVLTISNWLLSQVADLGMFSINNGAGMALLTFQRNNRAQSRRRQPPR